MDRNSIPNSTAPMQAIIPEEDAHLLAIEALEARSVDLNPVPPRSVQPHVHTPPPSPRAVPTLPPAPITPPIAPILVPTAPHVGIGVKEPVPPGHEKLKKPATPAEAIAEALAASSETTARFQFFTYRKAPRKPFIIIGIIVVVIGMGVGAYFTVR